jgi:hypothetical protein
MKEMKTLFTIHAGEFLVGSEIERRIPGANIWVPSKDKGIDLLISDSQNTRLVTIQVKFSRDFLVTHMEEIYQKGLLACGWWTHKQKNIQESRANLWIFVLQAFDPKKTQYIIISPTELEQRFLKIHGTIERIQSYLWVTEKGKCWEARGLSKRDHILIANNAFVNEDRNLTRYLNAWNNLEEKLK